MFRTATPSVIKTPTISMYLTGTLLAIGYVQSVRFHIWQVLHRQVGSIQGSIERIITASPSHNLQSLFYTMKLPTLLSSTSQCFSLIPRYKKRLTGFKATLERKLMVRSQQRFHPGKYLGFHFSHTLQNKNRTMISPLGTSWIILVSHSVIICPSLFPNFQ